MNMIIQRFWVKKLVFIFYVLLILANGFGNRGIIGERMLSRPESWSLFGTRELKGNLANQNGQMDFKTANLEYANYYRWQNTTTSNLPFYLPYEVNILLTGVIPLSYGQWIVYLIEKTGWKIQGNVPRLEVWYKQCPPIMLLGYYLLKFIDSVKIRE